MTEEQINEKADNIMYMLEVADYAPMEPPTEDQKAKMLLSAIGMLRNGCSVKESFDNVIDNYSTGKYD